MRPVDEPPALAADEHAGYGNLHAVVEGGEVERLGAPSRCTRAAEAVGVDVSARLEIVEGAHPLPNEVVREGQCRRARTGCRGACAAASLPLDEVAPVAGVAVLAPLPLAREDRRSARRNPVRASDTHCACTTGSALPASQWPTGKRTPENALVSGARRVPARDVDVGGHEQSRTALEEELLHSVALAPEGADDPCVERRARRELAEAAPKAAAQRGDEAAPVVRGADGGQSFTPCGVVFGGEPPDRLDEHAGGRWCAFRHVRPTGGRPGGSGKGDGCPQPRGGLAPAPPPRHGSRRSGRLE